MTWVVIETYSYPYEAQIAKTRLDAAEIPARIGDEHTINMNWLYSNALGGVRLWVPEPFAEQAYALIHEDLSEELAEQFDLDTPQCPNCGSTDLSPFTEGKRQAFMTFLFLGFPVSNNRKHGMKCTQCDYFIEDSVD